MAHSYVTWLMHTRDSFIQEFRHKSADSRRVSIKIMIHVTRESYLMCDVRHVNESHQVLMSHITVTFKWVTARVNESRHSDDSRLTRVMPHITRAQMSHESVIPHMTHAQMSHDSQCQCGVTHTGMHACVMQSKQSAMSTQAALWYKFFYQ